MRSNDHRVADTANSSSVSDPSSVSGLILSKFLVISESELLVSEISLVSRRLGLSLILGILLSVHQEIQASLGRRSNKFINFFLCICAYSLALVIKRHILCAAGPWCTWLSSFAALTPSLLWYCGFFCKISISGLGHTLNCYSY